MSSSTMDPLDDEDLLQQRMSASALKSLQRETATFDACRRRFAGSGPKKHERLQKRIARITALFDQFQEEPQMLDPHLKSFVPPLTDAFVALVVGDSNDLLTLKALARCLSTLCKVRGAKVVVRFMDNEARHIQPFVQLTLRLIREKLHMDDAGTPASGEDATKEAQAQDDMQLRYVLLLWLSHLVLTPFPLTSVGVAEDTPAQSFADCLPEGMPSIAKALVRIAFASLSSPAKDQWCAARVLVNLSLRPDMRKVCLLDRLMRHFIATSSQSLDATTDVHSRRGSLSFIDGLLRSASSDDVSAHLPSIFRSVIPLASSEVANIGEVQGSAMLRKASTKIIRLVLVHLLQGAVSRLSGTRAISAQMLDNEGSHQEAIGSLLEALADRDTQVRLAASKALAVITSKLEPDLAEQVVEAVMDAFDESVRYITRGKRTTKDLSGVSATKWHGLTLTLAHMLFRRSIRPEQISRALEALYSSLAFEQRSSSGSSLGANVRDAANFGLWSLARRYKTGELLALRLEPDTEHLGDSSIQRTAIELLVAACLDSTGNVRRGSSAALQELIGRHPDTIFEGIMVVQLVDYHAVGLRRRAMIDVALASASLGSSAQIINPYLRPLWDGLLDWRGIQTPDALSREPAATALQHLIMLFKGPEARRKFDDIVEILQCARQQDVDWRHGLMLALAAILTSVPQAMSKPRNDMLAAFAPSSLNLWILFDDSLRLTPKMLTTKSMKPDLMTVATMTLIRSTASFYLQSVLPAHLQSENEYMPSDGAVEAFATCLKTKDPATHQVIPQTCTLLRMLLPPQRRRAFGKTCEDQLRLTKTTPRRAGFMIALASLAFEERFYDGHIPDDVASEGPWLRARKMVIDIFDTVDDVDARITSLHCAALLQRGPEEPAHILKPSHDMSFTEDPTLDRLISDGLNDYTINERGDEGSRVRLEALETLMRIYSAEEPASRGEVPFDCKLAVQRLALERLDKVRAAASRALTLWQPDFDTSLDIMSEDYFLTIGQQLLTLHTPQSIGADSSSDAALATSTAFWTGISSSTGAGSDALIQTARSALYSILDPLPYPALHDILSALLPPLRETIESKNDRVLLPLLEAISFLFDAGIVSRLVETKEGKAGEIKDFKWTTLLTLIQKAHFKSSSLEKLLVCVQIYRSLVMLPVSTPTPARAQSSPTTDGAGSGSSATSSPAKGSNEQPTTDPLTAARRATLHKLTSMLLHPYPKIRVAVAEVLYVIAAPDLCIVDCAGEVRGLLRDVDWAASVKGDGAEETRGRVEGVRRLVNT